MVNEYSREVPLSTSALTELSAWCADICRGIQVIKLGLRALNTQVILRARVDGDVIIAVQSRQPV